MNLSLYNRAQGLGSHQRDMVRAHTTAALDQGKYSLFARSDMLALQISGRNMP
jgi:hypothetical protein